MPLLGSPLLGRSTTTASPSLSHYVSPLSTRLYYLCLFTLLPNLRIFWEQGVSRTFSIQVKEFLSFLSLSVLDSYVYLLITQDSHFKFNVIFGVVVNKYYISL